MPPISPKTVTLLREALPIIREAFVKIFRKHDNGEDWNAADRMNAYTAVYNLCNDHPGRDSRYVLEELYTIYEIALTGRITKKVIPLLENKIGKLFLRELVRQWSDYFDFTRSLISIFLPIEHKGRLYFTPSLEQISVLCFCELIWGKFLPIIDAALLEKVGSGALIEERPHDVDAKWIKKMMHFFSRMYRVHHDPDKYRNLNTKVIIKTIYM